MAVSAWLWLRGLFARVGSDPYYASYDRSLGNIKAEVDRLQAARAARAKAWAAVRARFLGYFGIAYAVVLAYAAYVNRQPHGTYTPGQQAARVAPAFAAPAAGWLAHRLLGLLQRALDRRSAARVIVLEAKLRKQVSELKDSTRYDRTLALLQKYDPDYVPPQPLCGPSARFPGGGAGSATSPGVASRAAGAAANMAGSALQGAGARMFPVLADLYSRAAGTLIADDPVMLGLLREAQTQSDILRHRLLDAEGRAVYLLQDNIWLKHQLGLPTEEEQAALAAWTGQPPPGAAEREREQGAGVPALPAAAAEDQGREAQDEEKQDAAEAEPIEAAEAEEAAGGSSDDGHATGGGSGARAADSGAKGVRRRRTSRA